ncbi:hypothetical protein G6F43_012748 [Rhizopus delemar]|nr:hypothetical protein G6F43_012748 [Rhizopus delemar]
MENTTIDFSTATTSTRATRRRPVCRSDNEASSKVRILETRSGRRYPRRIQSRLVTVSPSLDQSTVEPDYEVSAQTSARTSSSGNDGGTSLAVSPVLPTPRVISNSATDISQSSTTPDDASTGGKPFETQNLEALRLASLNNKFGTSAELSIASREFLSGSLTVDSATNRSYKAAQLAFVAWTLEENVDINNFSDTDVVNFLVHLHHSRHLGLNTLKLWRSAISRFHRSPSSLMNSPTIASFLATVAADTPPRPIHRPTVDLTPTLVYLSKIPSEATTSLSTLQSKLAFLLGMVAFLRPSDLARISLLSVATDSAHGTISFNIVAPKERRNKIRIIKPFLIHSHHDPRLCPVLCFQAVIHHPKATGRPPDVLFVNPQNPSAPVLSTTISSWLRRLIRLSTSEHRVSVRSLGSSQALRRGISVDDIVTLGNWRSSETFHNFYRREHMSTVNFTTTVLDMSDARVQVEEIDDLDDDSPDVPSLDQQL